MREQREIEGTIDLLERRALSHGEPPSQRVITALRWSLGDPSVPETAPLTLPSDDDGDFSSIDYDTGYEAGYEEGVMDAHAEDPKPLRILDALSTADEDDYDVAEVFALLDAMTPDRRNVLIARCEQIAELCKAAQKASA